MSTITSVDKSEKTHVAAIKPVTAFASILSHTGDLALILSAHGFDLRIHDFESNEILLTVPIFKSQIVHGIRITQKTVLDTADAAARRQHDLVIWGGRLVRYATLTLSKEQELENFEILEPVAQCDDWILDVCPGRGTRPAVAVTAHNDILALPLQDQRLKGSDNELEQPLVLGRGSRSILYSAHVIWKDDDTLLIAGGTAFGQILVQTCSFNESNNHATVQTHYVFSGHEGSIFGVQISESLRDPDSDNGTLRLLASCSDDRSIRLWNISDLSHVIPGQSADSDESGFLTGKTEHCLATAVGHISRVWNIRYVYATGHGSGPSVVRLISAGEDATCRAWDVIRSPHAEFKLSDAEILCEHSGKNIWAMEVAQTCHTNDYHVISGGADGSIQTRMTTNSTAQKQMRLDKWDLKDLFQGCHIETQRMQGRKDCFRALTLLQDGAMLVVSDQGHLFVSASGEAKHTEQHDIFWTLVDRSPALAGYSIGASTSDGKFAVLAGASGQVYSFSSESKTHQALHQCTRKVSGMWLERQNHENNGNLDLIIAELGSGAVTLLQLRAQPDNNVVVSHQYNANLGNHPVTAATSYCTAEVTVLAVGFRNGSICVFQAHRNRDASNSISMMTRHAIITSCGRESITHLRIIPDESRLLLISTGRDGYISMNRISLGSDSPALLIHRLSLPFGPHIEGVWICPLTQAIIVYGFHSTNLIVYDLRKQLKIATISCGGAHRTFALQLNSMRDANGDVVNSCSFAWTQAHWLRWQQVNDDSTRILQEGGHGRDIKACAISPTPLINESGSFRLIATGAEDTDIRLFRSLTDSFDCTATLRKHVTGIRCLKWSPDGTRLFSSGGKEELYVWRIVSAPIVRVGVVCEAAIPVQDGGSDLRIMSFDILAVNADIGGHITFILTLAYSNSSVKSYEYGFDGMDSNWKLLASTQYTTACLTHLEYLESEPHDSMSFITASTDGSLVLWQLEESTHKILAIQQLHQNAITACALHKLELQSWLVVTGGDDNALCFSILTRSDIMGASLRVPKAHSAAITGVHLEDAGAGDIKVITVGLDQRVREWRYSMLKTSVEKISSKWTSIADPAGINEIIFGVGMSSR